MAVIDRMGLGPIRTVERLENGYYKVTITPPSWSGIKGGSSIILDIDQFSRYNAWKNGSVLIQDALPELSASDREILMTGIGPGTWDHEFADDEVEIVEPEDQSQGDILGLDDEKPEF